jgi:ketosteroid isomerase-like protein
MLTDQEIYKATRDCIEAWNTLDLETTLATYTDDILYRDPATSGKIHGKDELRRYLTKFFRVWNMQFRVIEEHRLAGLDGQLVMWDCDISPRQGGKMLTVTGMDICMVRGHQLCRDEAFMDMRGLAELRQA